MFLLVVGLDCLKWKLLEQKISFFLPSPAGASWLQLRGANAKVKSLFRPSIFSEVFNVELMSVQMLSSRNMFGVGLSKTLSDILILHTLKELAILC